MNKQSNEDIIEFLRGKFGIQTSIDGNMLTGLCDEHGVFTRMLAHSKYKRYLCDACGVDARHNSNRVNAKNQRSDFKELCVEFNILHNNLYGYTALPDSRKIGLNCKIHGIFSIFKISHRKGAGCPSCRKEGFKKAKEAERTRLLLVGRSNVIAANKRKSIPIETVLEFFKNSHGDKFDYIFDNYIGKSGKVMVVCKEHGKTIQFIKEHIKSVYGCKHCAKYCVSSAELDWLTFVGVENRQKIIKHDFGHFKVDGFVEETNTVYEYLGDYWHGHPKLWGNYPFGINSTSKKLFIVLFEETNTRLAILHSLGYNVKYMWESEKIVRDYLGKLEYEIF